MDSCTVVQGKSIKIIIIINSESINGWISDTIRFLPFTNLTKNKIEKEYEEVKSTYPFLSKETVVHTFFAMKVNNFMVENTKYLMG